MLRAYAASESIELRETAYIGDDLPDVEVLKAVRFAGCPSDAVEAVKAACDYVSPFAGGAGAVRSFVELVLGADPLPSKTNKGGITAIIPCRKGSTRCPNKNTRPWCDTNLLERKIRQLKLVDDVADILVSSDCPVAERICRAHGVRYHRRDAQFCTSECGGRELFRACARQVTTPHVAWIHCVAPFADPAGKVTCTGTASPV